MAREYSDHMTQEAYEEGVRDAFEVAEPWEPSAEDRAWWDEHAPTGIAPMPEFTREEIEQMQRDQLADAMDEQWTISHGGY